MSNTNSKDGDIGSNQTEATSKPKPKKPMQLRSVVWQHFERTLNEEGELIKAQCNHCKRVLSCHSKRNGTSSLLTHMRCCVENPENQVEHQALINFQPSKDGSSVDISTWKFDQDESRKALARMLVKSECPFKFAETEGFQEFMSVTCPRFRIPSRWTMSRDCYQLFLNEKAKLKDFMNTNCERVCITTDTWTSVQKLNYMCVTAHFIDNEWKLHKKIINFITVSCHKGDYLGRALENCLLDWGLKSVFTITVDNASSNDGAISFMKRKIGNWGTAIASSKYLHMRCIAHVVNLVVTEGLKDIGPSVKRVRDAIRYIRNSPARIKRFKDCVELEGIANKSSLCLDVATRWNSTYKMLHTAEKYERAFEKYEEMDPCYKVDLGDLNIPSALDWICVRKYSDLLEHFYKLTSRISGSTYVTSNTFLSEISDLCCILNDWMSSSDSETKRLGISMKRKFDKYWGDAEKMNKIIFWANVFDPRDKLGYLEYSLVEMYGLERGDNIFQIVKNELFEVFNEYNTKYQPVNETNVNKSSSSELNCEEDTEVSVSKARYKRQRIESGVIGRKKSELDLYLSEATIDGKLDVLTWWKVNSSRFPILSKMARDILAVPISTVASEAAFSAGGRILDPFRSSLTPTIVEPLVCTQDWIRRSKHPISYEETLEELENMEKDLPTTAGHTGTGKKGAGNKGAGASSSSNPFGGLDLESEDFSISER